MPSKILCVVGPPTLEKSDPGDTGRSKALREAPMTVPTDHLHL